MESPSNRPKAGIWPLAFMALVVGMLTTLLVMVWIRKNDDKPNATPIHTVDRPTPPPTQDPVKPENGKTDPIAKTDPDKPPPVDQDPKDKAVLEKLEAARKALGENNIAAAQQLLAEAKKIKDVEAIKAVEESIRVAVARKEQDEAQRVKRDRDARAAKAAQEAEALWSANKYLSAEKRINDEITADPPIKTHPDIEIAWRKLQGFKNDAYAAWEGWMKKANAALADGRHGLALLHIRRARLLHPEEPGNDKATNDIIEKMRTAHMVRIPGGMEYKLGTPGRKDEPERDYKGAGFLMDIHEVTNEDYYAFTLVTGHKPPTSKQWVFDREIRHWTPYADKQVDVSRWPVCGITASDAEAYAKWLGKRLPTEDEWEYAARAIDGRTWPWGNDPPTLKDARCNFSDVRGMWRPVGSYPNGASAYGVFDLSGNVAEWTATEEAAGGAKGRVIKGGSFIMPADACRPAARYVDDAALPHQEVGFRCVRSLDEK